MRKLLLSIFIATALSVLPESVVLAQPLSFVIRADNYTEEVPTETVLSWFHLETRVIPRRDHLSEIADPTACPYPLSFCDFSLSRYSRVRTEVELSENIRAEMIDNYVSDLAKRILQDPTNAQFGVKEGNIVIARESVNGRRLDENGSIAAITEALLTRRPTADLPVQTLSPTIHSEDREKLGLRELIGSGTTDFRGSPKNRVHNIHRALEQFQDILIAPEENFSFVEHLGEVDGAHGYLPELVIKHDKTEPEFGGGICQVSSTLFRAAINTGLKITERKNHAYPVSYYKPYGMDATIYIPKPDLRFTNNTSGYILIHPEIEGTKLTFSFYGTNDGRKVEIDGPRVLISNPDGSMKTTFSQKVITSDGATLINDNFPSNYKSPNLYPHFEILSEKPKDWSKKQWENYLVEKADYEAKLRAAYATVVKPETTSSKEVSAEQN